MKRVLLTGFFILASNSLAVAADVKGLVCELAKPRTPAPTYMVVVIKEKTSEIVVRDSQALNGGTRFRIDAKEIQSIKSGAVDRLKGLALTSNESTLEFTRVGHDHEGNPTIDAIFVDDEIEHELAGCRINTGAGESFKPF